MKTVKIITVIAIFLVFVFASSTLAVSPKPGLFDNTGVAKKTGVSLPHFDVSGDTPEPLKAPILGTRKAIVILVEFTDNRANKNSHPSSAYEALLFDSTGAVPTGSMYDYFQEVSYGQFFITGEVTSWLELPETNEYYAGDGFGRGEWPQNRRRLAYDAVIAADPYVDFSQYDNDDDGIVDALFIVHAGPGGEETADSLDIWSHKSRIPANEDGTGQGYMTDDGVQALHYAMEPEEDSVGELITIGVFCHEYGHVMGLPDLYDRDESSEGVGNWALMGAGSWGGDGQSPELPVHLCAWSKEQLGWLTPIVVTENLIAQPLPYVESTPEVYKLWTDGQPGDEYFLMENRQQVGFDINLWNSGLLILHIDNSVTSQNDDEDHKLVDVEAADGCRDMDRGNGRGDDGDIYPGSANNRSFDLFSNPNSKTYGDSLSQVAVRNISDSQLIMTADIEVSTVAPFLIYDEVTLTDTDGNGDGKADPGETVDLVFGFINYGAYATGVMGRLSTLDTDVHLLVDETSFSDTPFLSYGNNSESPFSFSVEETADLHYANCTLDIWSQGNVDTSHFSFRVVIGHPLTLLVDDDFDTVGGEQTLPVEEFFTTALDNVEEMFDHWDYWRAGAPDSSWLRTYETVIWFTGHAGSTLTPEDQAHLAAFLDSGGKLFISGQDIATELQSSSFLSEYLHAEWIADNSEEGFISGVQGDPIGGSINMITISGDECADIQISPDAIDPMPEASTMLTYEPSGRAAGIRYADGYKMVYLAFGFEAIEAIAQDPEVLRATILDNILRWLRAVPMKGDVNEDGQVNILDVVWAVNVILQLVEPTPSLEWASDCNGDGNVNVLDAIGIVNVVLGLGECEPGLSKTNLTPEVMEVFERLEPYFSAESFQQLMTLVRGFNAPVQFSLAQNYPNPFNPETDIRYQISDGSSPTHTVLKVYNILGQEVKTLVDKAQEPGNYVVTWNGKDHSGNEVSSGVYFYRIEAGDFIQTKRMVLLK
jgi:M6 family metalloprotease-like protein